jgi:hypothetical protein
VAPLSTTLLVGLNGPAKRELIRSWRGNACTPVALLIDQGDDFKFPRATTGPANDGMEDPSIERVGGCACCTGRAALAAGLGRLTRRGDWSSLIVEANAAARPVQLIDSLRGNECRDQIDLVEVVALVELAVLASPAARLQSWLSEQTESSDRVVLRAAKSPDASTRAQSEERLRSWSRFESQIEWWWPGSPIPARSSRTAPRQSAWTARLIALAGSSPRWRWDWRAHPGWVFDRQAVRAALEPWVSFPDVEVRAAFRTEREWYLCHQGQWGPTQWRSDSRVQIEFSSAETDTVRHQLEDLGVQLAGCADRRAARGS